MYDCWLKKFGKEKEGVEKNFIFIQSWISDNQWRSSPGKVVVKYIKGIGINVEK